MKGITQALKQAAAGLLCLFNDRSDYRPAHCGNIRTLLLHLCDFDEQQCQWILRWLAYPLRNPGAKMTTALVFNGAADEGKYLFFRKVMAHVYGQNHLAMDDVALFSRFSRDMARSSLVMVIGTLTPRYAARLKQLVGNESVVVEEDGEHPYMRPNRMNFVFLSGAIDFLPEGCQDRRFVIVETPPPQSRGFYQAVEYEIRHGGAEAFREYLMRELDMGNFNASTMPPQPAMRNQEAA